MGLVAYGEYIVIEQFEEEQTGTIILPDKAKQFPVKGRVVSVGEGTRLRDGSYAKPKLAVGEIVYFARYSINEVEFERKKYKVVAERDILAVVHPDKKSKG